MKSFIIGAILAVLSFFPASAQSLEEPATCTAPDVSFVEFLETLKATAQGDVSVIVIERPEDVASLRASIAAELNMPESDIVEFNAHAFVVQQGNPLTATVLVKDRCVFMIGKIPSAIAQSILVRMAAGPEKGI